MDTLPLIVWYLDDPVADPALVPLYFVAREARKHVKVVLSGEGADELFGGYNIYREPLSLRALPGCRRPAALGLGARISVAGSPATPPAAEAEAEAEVAAGAAEPDPAVVVAS